MVNKVIVKTSSIDISQDDDDESTGDDDDSEGFQERKPKGHKHEDKGVKKVFWYFKISLNVSDLLQERKKTAKESTKSQRKYQLYCLSIYPYISMIHINNTFGQKSRLVVSDAAMACIANHFDIFVERALSNLQGRCLPSKPPLI